MTEVFIHGLGQGPESWAGVLSRLPAGGKAFVPDLPRLAGGRSVIYDGLYGALARELDALEGPLALCGLSLGAVLALNYALDRPQRVRALALIAPQYRMPRLLLGVQSAVFRLLPRRAFGGMGFSKRDVIALTSSMRRLDFTPRLGKLACPALIVCGGRDRANMRAAETLAALLPEARLETVAGGGHELNADAPEELARLLGGYLSDMA